MKRSSFLLLLVFITAYVLGFIYSPDHNNVEVSTKYRNLNTGEYVSDSSSIKKGDLLERLLIVENKGENAIDNINVSDKSLIGEKEYTLNLNAGQTEIIREKIVLNSDLEYLSDEIDVDGNNKLITDLSVNVEEIELDNSFFSISDISAERIDNNFDSYFKIFGENLADISDVFFQCNSHVSLFPINKKSDTEITLLIESNTLKSGSCEIGLVYNSVSYFSNKQVIVTLNKTNNSNLVLKRIVPNIANSSSDSLLILQGKGFSDVVAIQIDNGVVLSLNFLKKLSDTTMVVNIPKGLNSGEYFFRFLTEGEVVSMENLKFKIVENEV